MNETSFFSLAMNEVDISGIFKHEPTAADSSAHVILATFSLQPNNVLNWYFNGFPLESSNPYLSMEADGLNAVLHISKLFPDVYGTYSLKIEGTGISDSIVLSPGKVI